MDVDSSLLADGPLTVQIVGTPVAGQTGNRLGLDFSVLSAELAVIPLLAGRLLLFGGLGALLASRRKARATA